MTASIKPLIENSERFPYVTRNLIDLLNQGVLTNVRNVLVEPEYGYMSRIAYNNDTYRIIYGNDLGLNTGAAANLAKDKGYTKFMLRNMSVNCPVGTEFLLPWWSDIITSTPRYRENLKPRTTDQCTKYIEENLGYPVYVKPVDGSNGSNVFKIDSSHQLKAAITVFEEKKIRVITVEEQITMPDYRIVILDGEPISAYLRHPLSVQGDGKSTLRELLLDLQSQYEKDGRDTRIFANEDRIISYLKNKNLDLNHIIAKDSNMVLSDISNLSAGGTLRDVSHEISERWTELAIYIAHNFNLRLCGLDLACDDITDNQANYSVLEVNAAPGLDHYAASGATQAKIVQELYTRVFNAIPHS